jgi:glutaminyl-tRNA synthetase
VPEKESGTAGAEAVEVKGVIHLLSAAHAHESTVRLYDRLFVRPNPGKWTGNYIDDLNPSAKTVLRAYFEPSLENSRADIRVQFERHGYFTVDRGDSSLAGAAFNRVVTLRDSWGTGKT